MVKGVLWRPSPHRGTGLTFLSWWEMRVSGPAPNPKGHGQGRVLIDRFSSFVGFSDGEGEDRHVVFASFFPSTRVGDGLDWNEASTPPAAVPDVVMMRSLYAIYFVLYLPCQPGRK